MIPFAKYAHDAMTYEPSSGRLMWKPRPLCHFKDTGTASMWNKRFAGTEVKQNPNNSQHGHCRLFLAKRRYSVHRIIFHLMHGRWPFMIDHINGDPTDNRWANLREVTSTENAQNRQLSLTNQSGVIGVSFNKKRKKWQSGIKINGKSVALYWGDNFDEAVAARKAAEKDAGFHENHGRR